MFNTTDPSRSPNYHELDRQLASLFEGERNFIANAAQFSAFIYQTLAALNWAGFYLVRNEELILGPFQGKVACVRIPFGRGVCGTVAAMQKTLRVDDVHLFPGHIACDSASNSEIVLPIIAAGKLIGVFDIDSPETHRFSDADEAGLQMLIARFVKATDF
ncbi:GAF domain-containing protein [Chitinimonas sp. BJB300]|uniref:GAF domain-containing protein n=1 Tax=Chitinimonas sp. BJB300 TaxID=1559339 RepID=UPI000C0E1C22|nr:GAF domain-containing protein [Chitinimonas sp. BJB300]PHV13402.1 GAF domain-containing protein [Chitinimonas sp. BJB300]TSJ89722.1 GAF domain-containing protein [Chitinimonas sp. BJB300]